MEGTILSRLSVQHWAIIGGGVVLLVRFFFQFFLFPSSILLVLFILAITYSCARTRTSCKQQTDVTNVCPKLALWKINISPSTRRIKMLALILNYFYKSRGWRTVTEAKSGLVSAEFLTLRDLPKVSSQRCYFFCANRNKNHTSTTNVFPR